MRTAALITSGNAASINYWLTEMKVSGTDVFNYHLLAKIQSDA